MKENKKTNTLLESQRASLTREKKDILWNAIEADITAVPSPFLFSFLTQKYMTPFAVALMLMLGVGGTAYASNEARPGDLLFPIDQALEEIQLAINNNDVARAQLQIAFAEERLIELRSILSENATNDSATTGTSSTTSTATINSFEAEADVFTDTTIVKVEINDQKITFETTADTRAAVVTEIVDRFGIERSLVEKVLDFEIEDRASKVQDVADKILSDTSDSRVSKTLDLINKSVSTSGISDAEKARIVTSLLSELSGTRDRVRIEDDRVEIRDGNQRIEIREKDGETEIKIKSDDHADDDKDNDIDDDHLRNSSSLIIDEAEADVFTDTTTVKVELYNGQNLFFETQANTRAEVVAEIVKRTGATETEVDRVLNFEIEDRVSDFDDREVHSQSSSSDDSSRDDSDDSSDTFDDSDGRVRVEVKVEDGFADVRMEYSGKKDEFTTTYTDRTTLVTQLANKSGLSESVIGSNLDLEIKE